MQCDRNESGYRELEAYAQQLGCEKESWLLTYLGLTLGGNPNSLDF